jgi:hypothetical protein|tara:strand:- start:408 stop:545 length:138 start_codon:yes stop_codon:yes gene_type:complete
MLSFNSYGSSHLDFSLSDFCYEQPNVQTRIEKIDEICIGLNRRFQ